MKKLISLILTLSIILGLTAGLPVNASADDGYSWVLVDTYQYPVPEAESFTGSLEGRNIELQHAWPYGLGAYASKDYSNPTDMHAIYTWSAPPSSIKPNQTVTLRLEQTVISNKNGNYNIGFKPYFHMDAEDLNIGSATSSKVNAKIIYSDGTTAKHAGIGYKQDEQAQQSFAADMTLNFIGAGRPGDKHALYTGVYAGSPGSVGVRYTYEWKQIASDGISSDISGEWDINANGFKGKFNITSLKGSQFAGTVNIDAGRTDSLTNGSLSGSTVIFTRQWDNSSFNQVYTGTLTTTSDGKMTISGTFTSGSSTYTWTATKSAPKTSTTTPTVSTPAPGSTAAEAFESGSRIMWQPAVGLGYRLFRSASQSSLGISVTDFYITGTSYADVNIEPNTTYYYTVKPVLAEAKPLEGIDEKLGSAIATFTVTTGSNTYKPGSYKHFIMLKLDSPSMSVDGVSQEVDPGRGTSPMTISGRTMVPIRAVVEAMGGTVGWDNATQKITLTARGNVVEMWMGKTDIKINGVSKKMDVAPASKNSRTFVPVRFAAENLNCKVDWINSTKEAVIVYEE